MVIGKLGDMLKNPLSSGFDMPPTGSVRVNEAELRLIGAHPLFLTVMLAAVPLGSRLGSAGPKLRLV
jgi:hypothetical protein